MVKFTNNVYNNVVNGIVNVIYSSNKKEERWLVLLVIIGFILRLVAALNMGVNADDMIYASQSANIINTKLISSYLHPPLFFYLTDFSYKIFGYTTLASRFFPLIAGTALIVVIFLTAKLFFNKKVALGAAFFATFSSFLIGNTFTEHTLVTFFFVFFGAYAGLSYLYGKGKNYLVLSATLFGLGLLTKYNDAFFILSFFLFSFYFLKSKKEKIFAKRNMNKIFLFFIIILLFSLPFLLFNYFVYTEKGIMDYQFGKLFMPKEGVEINKAVAEL